MPRRQWLHEMDVPCGRASELAEVALFQYPCVPLGRHAGRQVPIVSSYGCNLRYGKVATSTVWKQAFESRTWFWPGPLDPGGPLRIDIFRRPRAIRACFGGAGQETPKQARDRNQCSQRSLARVAISYAPGRMHELNSSLRQARLVAPVGQILVVPITSPHATRAALLYLCLEVWPSQTVTQKTYNDSEPPLPPSAGHVNILLS